MALTSLGLTASTKRLSSALILATSLDAAWTPVDEILSAAPNMKAAIVTVCLFISFLQFNIVGPSFFLRCTHTDYCHHGLLCSCLSLRDVHNSAKRNRSQRGNWRWRS